MRRLDTKLRRDVAMDIDQQRMVINPMLRLVFSLTSLVDKSEIFEVSLLYFLELPFSKS